MRQLVRQLDLFISDKIITSQSSQLGPEFREQFRTRPQLNIENVRMYFSTHPSEVMAFRRYIQQLTDNGFISSDLAESLVIGAFESLELAPKNQALARTSILDPVRAQNDTVEVFDLNSRGEVPLDSGNQQQAKPNARQIDFGESLDRSRRRPSPLRSSKTSSKNRSVSSETRCSRGH